MRGKKRCGKKGLSGVKNNQKNPKRHDAGKPRGAFKKLSADGKKVGCKNTEALELKKNNI